MIVILIANANILGYFRAVVMKSISDSIGYLWDIVGSYKEGLFGKCTRSPNLLISKTVNGLTMMIKKNVQASQVT